MLLGFNLLLWTSNLDEEHFPLLGKLKAAGYDGVELPLFGGDVAHYARIGKVLKENGLRATGVAVMPDPARNCCSSDPLVKEAAVVHLKWAIDCLAAAGGEVLCGPFHQPLAIFSGNPPTADERANLVDVHRQAVTYAATKGIRLAIEPLNRFECYVLNTNADAADIVRRVAHPSYGYLYDTFHSNIEEKDPVGSLLPTFKEIGHVHLSENDRGTPGKGHIPFEATLRLLKQGGYNQWFVIEAFGASLPGISAATKVWRDFFPNREEVYRFGHDFLRSTWAKV